MGLDAAAHRESPRRDRKDDGVRASCTGIGMLSQDRGRNAPVCMNAHLETEHVLDEKLDRSVMNNFLSLTAAMMH